jgi:predicted AAA+ superfamily ATPase
MWIERTLSEVWGRPGLPVRVLRGMRQVGKTALLERLGGDRAWVSLDDALGRRLAVTDPALFLHQHPPPVTIDEAQYAPELFPALKIQVDAARRARRAADGVAPIDVAWVTGSNQIPMDREVSESLAGRATLHTLHTLSAHEVVSAGVRDRNDLSALLWRGGWPELHVDPGQPVGAYLDALVHTWIEKDIVLAAGIEKRGAFSTVLRHLAARTGLVLNMQEIATAAHVQVSTVAGWLDVLERCLVVRRLPVWSSNLHKRLTKTPKLYLLDTGLAARLQGWSELSPLLVSPMAGPLFETLVFGEMVRAIDHAALPVQVHMWRTREGEEVDFVLTAGDAALVIDAKLGVAGVSASTLPRGLREELPQVDRLILVTLGGERRWLSRGCEVVPLADLHGLLVDTFAPGARPGRSDGVGLD